MQVAQMVNALGAYLSDLNTEFPEQSFVTWTRADLRHYIRMAMLSAFAAKPSRFGVRKTVTPEGPFMDLGPECVDVLSVQGVLLPDGTFKPWATLVRKMREIPTTTRATCNFSSNPYAEVRYRVLVDPAAPRNIVLDPPLPPGAALSIVCATAPDMSGDEVDLDPALEPLVFHWALSYAFGTEAESTVSRERSNTLWNQGADILGLSAAARAGLRNRATA